MIFQVYTLMMLGISVKLAHYLTFFSSLLAEMRSILHENMEHIYHWNKNPMIKHAETDAITGNVNLLKHLRAMMLSFNFLVKVPLPSNNKKMQ